MFEIDKGPVHKEVNTIWPNLIIAPLSNFRLNIFVRFQRHPAVETLAKRNPNRTHKLYAKP